MHQNSPRSSAIGRWPSGHLCHYYYLPQQAEPLTLSVSYYFTPIHPSMCFGRTMSYGNGGHMWGDSILSGLRNIILLAIPPSRSVECHPIPALSIVCCYCAGQTTTQNRAATTWTHLLFLPHISPYDYSRVISDNVSWFSDIMNEVEFAHLMPNIPAAKFQSRWLSLFPIYGKQLTKDLSVILVYGESTIIIIHNKGNSHPSL